MNCSTLLVFSALSMIASASTLSLTDQSGDLGPSYAYTVPLQLTVYGFNGDFIPMDIFANAGGVYLDPSNPWVNGSFLQIDASQLASTFTFEFNGAVGELDHWVVWGSNTLGARGTDLLWGSANLPWWLNDQVITNTYQYYSFNDMVGKMDLVSISQADVVQSAFSDDPPADPPSDPSTVPEPASMLLVGGALVAIFARLRRHGKRRDLMMILSS